MRSTFLLTILIAHIFTSCVKDRSFPSPETIYQQAGKPEMGSRELVHYWNFNDAALLQPSFSVGAASISYTGGSGIADPVSPGADLNARNGDIAGNGLRLRNPAGVLELHVPTVNYKDILFTFDLQRSSNGPQINKILYSVDGSHFTNEGLKPYMNLSDVNWQTFSYNFGQIEAANNNPNFKIRIEYAVNHNGETGNSRYDNITIDGNVIDPNYGAPKLIHYWDFNDNTHLLQPSSSIGNAALSYDGTGIGAADEFKTGSELNARNGSTAGSALRLRNPAGVLNISVPTVGYKNIKISMAVQRSGSGAETNQISYTLDGSTYLTQGLENNEYTPGTDPEYVVVGYDFSKITGANNNPNFKVKIVFLGSVTGTSGNNRFDNIVIEGNEL